MKITLSTVLRRAIRQRCPQCGQGPLYRRWYQLRERCEVCAYDFRRDPVDIVSFLYISTALLTGMVVLVMFGVSAWFPERELRWIVLAVAVAVILLSLPHRKALAIALDYWTREHWEKDED